MSEKNMLEFVLAVLGMVLIYAEFFLPGAILAILGGLSLLVSAVLSFMRTSPLWGSIYVLILGGGVILTCKLALRRMQFAKTKDRFFLEKDQEGYLASSFDQNMIGKTGVVSTELKPSGHIIIDGVRFQALSETGFLEKGKEIEVVGGQGSHLIVRAIILK